MELTGKVGFYTIQLTGRPTEKQVLLEQAELTVLNDGKYGSRISYLMYCILEGLRGFQVMLY